MTLSRVRPSAGAASFRFPTWAITKSSMQPSRWLVPSCRAQHPSRGVHHKSSDRATVIAVDTGRNVSCAQLSGATGVGSSHRGCAAPGLRCRDERRDRMTVSPVTGGDDVLDRVRRENETLYAVIKTVSSSLALERVLAGIIEIATDATRCHAAFIYFLKGERLVLEAAAPPHAHLVGQLEWGIDEGLTGWVARTRRPEFIRERAMEDPRMKYVPELEEERFQSMVAVPLLYRSGAVMGVIVLHTVAPREFEDDVLKFLVHTASLAAGAIENAQLYEETRRRVDALTTLTRLSQALAAVTLREDLHDAVTRGARELLGADTCQIWRLDSEADELSLAAADPPEPPGAPSRPGRAALLLDIVGREKRGGAAQGDLDDGIRLLVAPLVAGEERLGLL